MDKSFPKIVIKEDSCKSPIIRAHLLSYRRMW